MAKKASGGPPPEKGSKAASDKAEKAAEKEDVDEETSILDAIDCVTGAAEAGADAGKAPKGAKDDDEISQAIDCCLKDISREVKSGKKGGTVGRAFGAPGAGGGFLQFLASLLEWFKQFRTGDAAEMHARAGIDPSDVMSLLVAILAFWRKLREKSADTEE